MSFLISSGGRRGFSTLDHACTSAYTTYIYPSSDRPGVTVTAMRGVAVIFETPRISSRQKFCSGLQLPSAQTVMPQAGSHFWLVHTFHGPTNHIGKPRTLELAGILMLATVTATNGDTLTGQRTARVRRAPCESEAASSTRPTRPPSRVSLPESPSLEPVERCKRTAFAIS